MNEVLQCIYERRSVRKFDNRTISQNDLEAIMKCAIEAPNGHNKQTWRFTVLQGDNRIKEIQKVVEDTLDKTGIDTLQGFENPSVIVIVTNRKSNYNAMADGACAISSMLLGAWSLGIGGVWINALRTIQDETLIRQLFASYKIPEDHMVVGMVALGYILKDESIPPKPRRREGVIHYFS